MKNKYKIYDVLEQKGYYLIGEVGVNYYDIARIRGISLMDAAKLMVKEGKESGLDAVKFQTYKAGKIAAKNSPSYWDTSEEPTTSQYELFTKFDKWGEKEYKEIADYAAEIGIEFFSTPFDFESSDFLFEHMNIYKISSSDLSNIPFIEHIAKKGKPIILSTGASNLDEIELAVKTITEHNNEKLMLLHCVLEYPTPIEHANLNKIASLEKKFPNVIVGYSDHTKVNMDILKTAFNMGAKIIEKHYTLNKTLQGNDHYHAMDPEDIKEIIKSLELMKTIRGSYEIKSLDSENSARRNARRSIVSSVEIHEGDVITEKMLTFKRPGTGIPPYNINIILGKKAKKDIKEDTILQEEMFE